MWPSSLSHTFAPDGSDIRASLDFTLGPLLDSANPIAVTVPLANTVFQNGRQSTLLAGLWARSEKGSFKLSSLEERHTQLVVPSLSNSALTSNVSIPLISITAPRKVLAGLGNIIRQVEADGFPSPASKELERDIPRLLKAREKASAAEITGPLGVWALVVPESLATPGLLAEISATPILEIEAERAASAKFSRLLPELVASGCHIHRIRESTRLLLGSAIPDVSSERRRRMGVEAGSPVVGSSDELLPAGRCRGRRELHSLL
jgi:hypothetical protein